MRLTRSRIGTAIEVLLHGGFPWPARPALGARPFETRFRRAARRAIMVGWPATVRPIAAAVMALLWPAMSLRDAARFARYAAPRPSGTAEWALRALRAWRFAVRHNVPPYEYFAFRLGEAECPDAWITGEEGTRVLGSLLSPAAQALADDKHAFAAFCVGEGIPALPTLARYAAGQVAEPFAGGDPPAESLVIKPRIGARTLGVEAWLWRGDAYHPAEGGPSLSTERFLAHLAEHSAIHGEILVQRALRPHPALCAVAGLGVPVARIVTGAWPNGRVEMIDAMIQRPAEGEFVAQGYRFALVDTGTGRVRNDAPGQVCPVFGFAALDPGLVGLALPDWEAVRAIVLEAHAAFPAPAPLLGWDVAFTDTGAVLIETNVGLSFALFQMTSLEPALRGPLGPALGAWLS